MYTVVPRSAARRGAARHRAVPVLRRGAIIFLFLPAFADSRECGAVAGALLSPSDGTTCIGLGRWVGRRWVGRFALARCVTTRMDTGVDMDGYVYRCGWTCV